MFLIRSFMRSRIHQRPSGRAFRSTLVRVPTAGSSFTVSYPQASPLNRLWGGLGVSSQENRCELPSQADRRDDPFRPLNHIEPAI